jgi:hypothetical protein
MDTECGTPVTARGTGPVTAAGRRGTTADRRCSHSGWATAGLNERCSRLVAPQMVWPRRHSNQVMISAAAAISTARHRCSISCPEEWPGRPMPGSWSPPQQDIPASSAVGIWTTAVLDAAVWPMDACAGSTTARLCIPIRPRASAHSKTHRRAAGRADETTWSRQIHRGRPASWGCSPGLVVRTTRHTALRSGGFIAIHRHGWCQPCS